MDEQRKENYTYSYDEQKTTNSRPQYHNTTTANVNWALLTSWPFIVGAFVLGFWPVGVFLLWKAASLDEEKKRAKTKTPSRTVMTKVDSASVDAKTVKSTAAKSKKTKKKSKSSSGSGLGFIIAGAILAFAGVASMVDTLDVIYLSGTYGGYLSDIWTALTMFTAGGGMLGVGIGAKKQAKRFPLYKNVINNRSIVAFDEIASVMGLSRRKVVKDLKKMVEKGLLGSGAYLDMARGVYVADADVMQNVLEKEEKKPEKPLEGYEAILKNLRTLNDRIEDEEISRQIDRIEEISRQIFREVERNPEKEKKISALMNGYLPTTQKLLDSYATFEEAGVDGEKTAQAKQRIAANMARIVRGFEKQLDELYSMDVLDVETDIRVMESMLRRDGADESDELQLKL